MGARLCGSRRWVTLGVAFVRMKDARPPLFAALFVHLAGDRSQDPLAPLRFARLLANPRSAFGRSVGLGETSPRLRRDRPRREEKVLSGPRTAMPRARLVGFRAPRGGGSSRLRLAAQRRQGPSRDREWLPNSQRDSRYRRVIGAPGQERITRDRTGLVSTRPDRTYDDMTYRVVFRIRGVW